MIRAIYTLLNHRSIIAHQQECMEIDNRIKAHLWATIKELSDARDEARDAERAARARMYDRLEGKPCK